MNLTLSEIRTGPFTFKFTMQGQKPIVSICLFLLCVCGGIAQPTNAPARNPSEDDIPSWSFDGRFSTNWYAAVQAALPAGHPQIGRYDFQAATNVLCLESEKKNLAAQALWGTVLVVLSGSQETTEAGLKLLRSSAEAGNVPAMINLGCLFEAGKYVRRNYDEAFRWFSRAAECGNADAQLQLGGCYHYGLGTTPDYSMAAKYYRLAAGQTNYVAMKSLGFLMMKGYGVDTNEDEARAWLMRAAKEGGNRRAMYDLGVLYAGKYPDTNAVIEAFKWLMQGAERGDALAAFELSNFYYRGWGAMETNLASYRYWRYKGAFLGSTEAQAAMGQAYRTGDGVPVDLENSLVWTRKAAAKNQPDALYNLAVSYHEDKTNHVSLVLADELMIRAAQMGHREAQFQCAMSFFRGDVLLSSELGKEWLAKAAETGWPKAEFCLFQMYYHGLSPGTNCTAYPKDKTEAVKWLRRAAKHGDFQAQSTLAVMEIRGLDMEPDKAKAGELLRNAAQHGYAPAQNDLGYSILNGDVVAADPMEAALWCGLAVSHPTDANVARRANVNYSNALVHLTLDQQEEVKRRVRNFQPQPVPKIDPKIAGWEKNPAYQPEDGRFGH